jgi:hypothetical protein
VDQEAHASPEQSRNSQDQDEGKIGVEPVLLDGDGQEHTCEGDDRAD